MIKPEAIQIEDYNYNLPKDRIAQYPLNQRDISKLVIFQNNSIKGDQFKNIYNYLPGDAFLFFNETKVVQARLIFQKPTGAKVEIFCLEPIEPTHEIVSAFQQKSPVTWKCLVGNAKKWKEGCLEHHIDIDNNNIILQVNKKNRLDDSYLIEFSWDSGHSFSEILEHFGQIPLPPYMNREAEENDKTRYQTVYARQEGSVAAPTAGLHFTPSVFDKLKSKGIRWDNLALHVGAGTFKPVSASSVKDHEMHTEQVVVSKKNLLNILDNIDKTIVSVGTTTMRTLESVYWFGVKIIVDNISEFKINQWDPYLEKYNKGISVEESVNAVINLIKEKKLDKITGLTQLIIVSGYEYKIAKALITNFHQPKSTLLLLVAAFIGDSWKDVYEYSLKNDFRFLSYGDSCLFFR